MKHPVNVGDTMDGKKVVEACWFIPTHAVGQKMPFYKLHGEDTYRQAVPIGRQPIITGTPPPGMFHDWPHLGELPSTSTPLQEVLTVRRAVELIKCLQTARADRHLETVAEYIPVDGLEKQIKEAEDRLYLMACNLVAAALTVPVVAIERCKSNDGANRCQRCAGHPGECLYKL